MKRAGREPAVAGMFYPADSDELRRMVRRFLRLAERTGHPSPKAIIVPHAGYIYSGAIAATAYACVDPEKVSKVVLMGPSHRVLLHGMAAPETLWWKTPLGDVRIDFGALHKISMFSQVLFAERAHTDEHCLEVQLPFLQEVLGDDFLLSPLVVGDARPADVAGVLKALWGGPETLVVISSDLTHYLPYEESRAIDLKTARAIEALDVHGVDDECACGLNVIRGLVFEAHRRKMRAELLDLRSSGDTAGSKDQVVGYGAFAFYD